MKTRIQAAWIFTSILVATVAYWPGITSYFHGEELNGIQAALEADDPFAFWSGRDGQPGFLRPLIAYLYWQWAVLWHLNPLPYHLLNFTVHLLNSALAGLIAHEIIRQISFSERVLRFSALTPLVAFTWFVLWPSHSEPVVWFAAITDIAAAFFSLASVWVYLIAERKRSWGIGLIAVMLFALGLSSKESAIPLPGVILILFLSISGIQNIVGQWPRFLIPAGYFLVLAIYMQLRLILTGSYIGGYGDAVHRNFSWVQLRESIPGNLTNVFLPLPYLSTAQKWATIAIGTFAFGFGILKLRKINPRASRLVAGLALSAIVAISPAINLRVGIATEQQRFAYLGSAFGVLAWVFMATCLIRQRHLLIMANLLVLVPSTFLLFHYNSNWKTAGQVVKFALQKAGSLPKADRYLVLTVPDAYMDAFILRNGLAAGTKLLGTVPGELHIATRAMHWDPHHKIIVTKLSNSVYDLTVTPASQGKLPTWILPNPSPQFRVQSIQDGVRIQLTDYDPTSDRIAVLQGSTWQLLY